MVIAIIIKPDKVVFPLVDKHGNMLKWPTICEARAHIETFKLEQCGTAKCYGLHDDDPETGL